MPAFKIRQATLPVGGFTSGGNFLFGSACINCPSATGHATVVSASLAITGVADGDKMFVMPHTSAPSGMVLRTACAVAGGISASWFNSACLASAGSADVPVSYLVFS
jgi:hypothetical protein